MLKRDKEKSPLFTLQYQTHILLTFCIKTNKYNNFL